MEDPDPGVMEDPEPGAEEDPEQGELLEPAELSESEQLYGSRGHADKSEKLIRLRFNSQKKSFA